MDVNIPTIAKTLNIMVVKLNGFTVLCTDDTLTSNNLFLLH